MATTSYFSAVAPYATTLGGRYSLCYVTPISPRWYAVRDSEAIEELARQCGYSCGKRYNYFCPLLGTRIQNSASPLKTINGVAPTCALLVRRAHPPDSPRRPVLAGRRIDFANASNVSLHNEPKWNVSSSRCRPRTAGLEPQPYGFPHPECENPPLDNWLMTADLMSQFGPRGERGHWRRPLSGCKWASPAGPSSPAHPLGNYPLHHD